MLGDAENSCPKNPLELSRLDTYTAPRVAGFGVAYLQIPPDNKRGQSTGTSLPLNGTSCIPTLLTQL